MLRFERTWDYSLVREVVTHPKVWPWVTDDFSPAAGDYLPVEHPGVWYMLAWDDGELLGLWAFTPENGVCWEVHTCLLPGHGFRRARAAARGMRAWLWANTPCRRVVTKVPAYNRIAYKFAVDAGLEQFGLNPKSIQKNGRLHDQALLGVSKPDKEGIICL
ncbi:MAG: hypothetical protein ACRD9L_05990 [Bryobacteraceae bacterium]